jgi:hypothetical protein
MVRLDANGRVAAYIEPVAGDGWSTRGTFRGDGVAFTAAKGAVIPRCRSGTRKTGQ